MLELVPPLCPKECMICFIWNLLILFFWCSPCWFFRKETFGEDRWCSYHCQWQLCPRWFHYYGHWVWALLSNYFGTSFSSYSWCCYWHEEGNIKFHVPLKKGMEYFPRKKIELPFESVTWASYFLEKTWSSALSLANGSTAARNEFRFLFLLLFCS